MGGRLGRSETGPRARPAVAPLVAKARRKDRPGAFSATLTEDQLHRSVAELLDWVLSMPVFWTTFPAGWGKLPKATAGRLKASGLKEGVPDVLIVHDGKPYWVELKVPGNYLTKVQSQTQTELNLAGCPTATCHSLEEVMEVLDFWGIPHASLSMADQVTKARKPEEPAQGETEADW